MNKAGCSIALIVATVVGGVVLHYLLSAFSAFQWFMSSGASSTGWVDGAVVTIVLVTFVVGFLTIMLMPDDHQRKSDQDQLPPN